MSLNIKCCIGTPIPGNHYADTHGPGHSDRPTPCNQPPVMLILEEQEVWHAGDVQEDILTAYPYCAGHAPEQVHEARSSMADDEYRVVTLPVTPERCTHPGLFANNESPDAMRRCRVCTTLVTPETVHVVEDRDGWGTS